MSAPPEPIDSPAQRLSKQAKLTLAVSAAIVVAGVILAVALGSGSGSSISDSAPCADFVSSDPGEQSHYMADKVESATDVSPSPEEISAYTEGFELNCSKGYPNSTVEREFETTQSEIAEVETEGGDLKEGVSLIRERTEEREVYGEFNEESGYAEELEEEGY